MCFKISESHCPILGIIYIYIYIHIYVERGRYIVDPGKKLVSDFYSMHPDFSVSSGVMDYHVARGILSRSATGKTDSHGYRKSFSTSGH